MLDLVMSLLILAFLLLLAGVMVSGVWAWLAEDERWKVAALFVVPLGVLVVGGQLMAGLSGFVRFSKRPKKPLVHVRGGGYSAADLEAQNGELRADGVKAYRRMLGWDLLFPLLYGPALFYTLSWAAEEHGLHSAPLVLAIVPALTMLCDWIENGILLAQTRRSATALSSRAIKAASLATQAKIVGYYLCAVLPPASWIVRKLWDALPF